MERHYSWLVSYHQGLWPPKIESLKIISKGFSRQSLSFLRSILFISSCPELLLFGSLSIQVWYFILCTCIHKDESQTIRNLRYVVINVSPTNFYTRGHCTTYWRKIIIKSVGYVNWIKIGNIIYIDLFDNMSFIFTIISSADWLIAKFVLTLLSPLGIYLYSILAFHVILIYGVYCIVKECRLLILFDIH